jgi:hypothetical protein
MSPFKTLAVAVATATLTVGAVATPVLAQHHYNNPPGPRGGPGTNWENPPGWRGGPGAWPDRRYYHDHGRRVTFAYRHGYYYNPGYGYWRPNYGWWNQSGRCWWDRDDNPPGPRGGPGTNWENPPGWRGGPGASPDRYGRCT